MWFAGGLGAGGSSFTMTRCSVQSRLGVLSEVMMTMTTLPMDPTPQCSPTQLTCDKSSFILQELPETNSSICCCDNECSYPSNILCKIPTRKFHKNDATTAVKLLDNDDNNLLIANAQEDMTPTPTLLQEWEAFYLEFKTWTTYALGTPVQQTSSQLLLMMTMTTMTA